jgi:hypothetical protein
MMNTGSTKVWQMVAKNREGLQLDFYNFKKLHERMYTLYVK